MSGETTLDALNRLCKWRAFFAGWLLGTRPVRSGPARAARDLTDAGLLLTAEVRALGRLTGAPPDDAGAGLREILDTRLVLRAKVNAITGLCLDRGVFTAADFDAQLAEEADDLARALSARYPGWRATDDGLIMDMPAAAETMTREGFPP